MLRMAFVSFLGSKMGKTPFINGVSHALIGTTQSHLTQKTPEAEFVEFKLLGVTFDTHEVALKAYEGLTQ